MKFTRNYKLILLISIIISSSIIGIVVANYIIKNNSDDNYCDEESYYYQTYCGDIFFEYEIRSLCSNNEINESLDIVVSSLENELTFDQIFYCYCCPRPTNITYFIIEIELLSNNLTLREIYDPHGGVCRCICPYGITGKISNLTSDSYNLKFIWENLYVNQTGILKEFEIDI